jgi:hypothetical protein
VAEHGVWARRPTAQLARDGDLQVSPDPSQATLAQWPRSTLDVWLFVLRQYPTIIVMT